VRYKPEYLLIAAMSAFALTGVVATALEDPEPPVVTVDPIVVPLLPSEGDLADARIWFESVRRYCNPVEVETRLRWQPAPPTPEGDMHEAACYALAGKVQSARQVIQRLPEGQRLQAAGLVFEAGHPAADAGDETAAGPLMELVVEFWPNHYMALYHAGAARFEAQSDLAARRYLERFLAEYGVEDGWRESAERMLAELDARPVRRGR
jgi:hypothetical protein